MGLELSTVLVWHTLERSTKEEKGIHELRGMKKLGIALKKGISRGRLIGAETTIESRTLLQIDN